MRRRTFLATVTGAAATTVTACRFDGGSRSAAQRALPVRDSVVTTVSGPVTAARAHIPPGAVLDLRPAALHHPDRDWQRPGRRHPADASRGAGHRAHAAVRGRRRGNLSLITVVRSNGSSFTLRPDV